MPLARELFAVAGQVEVTSQIEQHIARNWPAIKTIAGASSVVG